ncbi:DUF6415 family natural product biosynthesis protein [Streptomyces sp. NPDC057301]|uniref:DUF6415 family natural product biosynthesis protein n=1 Tax=Streptomyces sp. NPDC057301 TaxID=3346093 RepID=UPI00362FD8A2
MTATTVDRWNHPVGKWEPQVDREAVKTVLGKIRQWQPFDDGVLLDDVGAVVDDCLPPEDLLDELAECLHSHSAQLVDIAVAANAEYEDEVAARLIERARTVRSEQMPADYRQAVGHLRGMAWSVGELHERLVATRCVKEAA